VRQAHGLAAGKLAPVFDPMPAQCATLCCYSPLLAPVQPDAPPRCEAIGFPLYDRGDVALDPVLATFLDCGPAPIVFTLGSFVVHAPGRFYDVAAAAARALGRRAVLLTGTADSPCVDGDLLRLGYAPHSQLFDRAAAVVHHGGIGTTGQAMHAGAPQLVLPFFGDQFDNGARIARLGIGRSLRPAAFQGAAADEALRALLGDHTIAARAAAIATQLCAERPTETAADRIIAAALRRRPSP
jgi:rhamnosyltransferase subunit B